MLDYAKCIIVFKGGTGTLSPRDFDILHFINSKEELLKELFKIIDN